MKKRLGIIAAAAVLIFGASLSDAAEPPAKISNFDAQPFAAERDVFLRAAFEKPKPGVCQALSPDPGFVNEMLVRFADDGTKSFERRVALVVGNEDYRNFQKLKNPASDATSMARLFRALGFTVYRAIDATTAGLNDCFNRFKADLEAEPPDVALFYYAGHGVQLTSATDNEKRNYMLAVDADIDGAGKASGFRQIDAVLNEMRAHSRQSILFYDACRNAPIAEGTVKEADGQSVRGAAAVGAAAIAVEDTRAADSAGIYIAYSTAPNRTADDAYEKNSNHSPFTRALLNHIAMPGYSLIQAMSFVSNDVGQLTNWSQTPWQSSSLTNEIRLNGRMDANTIRLTSENFAEHSRSFREQRLRSGAIVNALKGISKSGSFGIPSALFKKARAELFLAYNDRTTRFIGHDHAVSCATFSPRGDQILTSSMDQTAKLWDGETGLVLRTVKAHEDGIVCAVFHPDGIWFATASFDNTAKIWNTDSGELQQTLIGHEGAVLSIAFSPSGRRIITGSSDNTARIWNSVTGELLMTLDIESSVNAAVFSADGNRAALGTGNGLLQVWDKTTSLRLFSVRGHEKAVTSVAYSPNGKIIVTTSYDGSAKIWNSEFGTLLQTLVDGDVAVASASFNAEGDRIVMAFGDGTAKIWDANTGAFVKTLEGHANPVLHAEFSPDGSRVVTAGSDDRSAKVWDLRYGEAAKTYEDKKDRIWSVAISPNGKQVATGTEAGTAKLWDAESAKVLRTLHGHSIGIHGGAVFDVDFSSDSAQIVTAAEDDTAKVWDTNSGVLRLTIQGHGDWVNSAEFSASGKEILTASLDGTARVWDSSFGTLRLSLTGHEGIVSNAAFGPDDAYILTGSNDSTAKIWDANTGDLITTLNGHEKPIWDVEYNYNGSRILTASHDRTAKIWDVKSESEWCTLQGHTEAVRSASFSPDGAIVALASEDRTVTLWDAATCEKIRTIQGYGDKVVDASFSSDGRYILTGAADGKAHLWEVGLYGPELLDAAYALLTEDLRAEVERERIRYWPIDPKIFDDEQQAGTP